MGWALGFDEDWHRDIGYGVPATCDHPGCGKLIHRGLSHVCGGEPYGGEDGCGLYFCGRHMTLNDEGQQVCCRCELGEPPFEPTPDIPEWTDHKATDPSWAEWRASQTA